MKETLIAFVRVPEKTVRGVLWSDHIYMLICAIEVSIIINYYYCPGNHELLSCFSVLFFKIFPFTSLMVFASPVIVIIFVQLFQFNTVA